MNEKDDEIAHPGMLSNLKKTRDLWPNSVIRHGHYEKVARLDNGWVIEFNDYDYFCEYHPEIVVFSTQFKGITLYKVVIEGGDDIYDVTRLH